MQNVAQNKRDIVGTDMLDACLYRPLEQLDLPIPPRFDRVASGGLEMDSVDVLLREGQDTSYILEFPSPVVGAKSFSVSFSFLRNKVSEPGWLLSCSRPNTFFMFYAPETEDGSVFHALMVSRLKIMKVLDELGYDRASLGLREAELDEELGYSKYDYKNKDTGIPAVEQQQAAAQAQLSESGHVQFG